MKRIPSFLMPKGATRFWTPMLAGVILVATAAVGMADRQLQRAIETNPINEWIDGPVSYILSSREREAFESLKTDEERDMFIQQFWGRRNPIPGSATNNFKEEFYRRVKFANAHFAYFHPGWMSDRGHMYIDYGPPDEIQFHPNSKPYHFSVWKYHYLPTLGENVVFVFVDLAGNGNYRTAAPPWK
jgi:GWxTD domain-containing protein